MLVISEAHFNKTEDSYCHDSDWYEPFTDDLGKLFKSLQRAYGRCISKVYQDNIDGTSWAKGWAFEKKHKYVDCNKYYIAETWVMYKHIIES